MDRADQMPKRQFFARFESTFTSRSAAKQYAAYCFTPQGLPREAMVSIITSSNDLFSCIWLHCCWALHWMKLRNVLRRCMLDVKTGCRLRLFQFAEVPGYDWPRPLREYRQGPFSHSRYLHLLELPCIAGALYFHETLGVDPLSNDLLINILFSCKQN